MRILLAGHLDAEVVPSLGFTDSRLLADFATIDASGTLRELARGITHARPNVQVEVQPWGPGLTFIEALRGTPGDPYLVSVPRTDGEWHEHPGSGPLIVEMGHDRDHDGGVRVLKRLNHLFAGSLLERKTTVAASTSRSELGPGGTAMLTPDLTPRPVSVGAIPSSSTPYLPGSGAGGGAAARLASRGADIRPTGQVLSNLLDLHARLDRSDLVIVVHPFWHAPDLVDAPELEIAEAAAGAGLPVIGVGIASSLSAPEMAAAGVSGIHLRRRGGDLFDVGKRIANTWVAE